MSQINYSAIFDGVNLTTIIGLTVLATDPYMPPTRKLTLTELARSNKSTVSSAFYKERTITVSVGISRSNRGLAEASLDSLMKIIQGVEKDLVLSQSGITRRYIVTLNDVNVKRSGGMYLEMDLIFSCSDMFGYDVAYTRIVSATGFTSFGRTDTFSVDGSAPWQAPLVQVAYTALSITGNQTARIGNQDTGQQLAITRAWVTGDVLIADSLNQTVKVNGADVAFTGAFPEFATNTTGYLTYNDTFTSRTFNYLAYYYKRYS